MSKYREWLQQCVCKFGLLFGVLFLALSASPADAAELSGVLTDAATGAPIAGATVRVLGSSEVATTGADGQYVFDLPEGVYELSIAATVGGELHESRMVRQYVPQFRVARPHVYTDWFLNQGVEPLENAPGLPSFSGMLPDDGPESVDLGGLFNPGTNPAWYTLPGTPPTTIRVGRRRESTGSGGCTDAVNPVVAIESMDLDEYVKGVLPPEIGVFQNIPGVSEVYKAFAVAAKSYALYFMLRYDAGNRRSLGRSVPPHGYSWFHIDDTACNQRYTNQRLTITTNAANAVAHKILVNKSDTNQLDKYEYAASCGKHGTRPEHQTALVSDRPPVSACAGTWCGHNACAGHERNPAVSGSNSCLVRGICQWGAASWGQAGKTYAWMLAHYQPNLVVREIGNSGPQKVALSGYAYTNADDISGSGVSGVTISLSDGQSTTTNAQGQYLFDEVRVDLGTVEITASKTGYETNTRTKDIEPGVTNWGSIQITRQENPPDPDPDPDPDPEPDSGTPAPDAGAEDVSHTDSELLPDEDSGPGELDTRDSPPSDTGETPDSELSESGSGLGPLLQYSDGTSPSGCGCAASGQGSGTLPGGAAVAILWMGWLFFRRRQYR